MRNHGGAVTVESAPGEGATFSLYFPEPDAAELDPPEFPEPAASFGGRGERILLVDDDDAMLFMALRYLGRCGYSVRGCASPDAALTTFAADPSAFDLVVTDLNMPGMSGLELAARMLSVRPDANIVLTSGYVAEEDAARARRAGVRDIVLKPDTIEQLAPLMESLLASANATPPADDRNPDG
jgi:CheY-like chemotaxis protein